MALYTRQSRENVRDAIDFVELVSARSDLRRAGPNRYEGLCPFHEERTPSFGIDPVQKVYYCFGCQAAGDLFTFVQEMEGVDFKGAMELLAERAGIELELEREDPQESAKRRRRDRLLELIRRTVAYYERMLWESSEADAARRYLLSRGLSEQSLKSFNVGYAPSAWDKVLTASLRSGYSEAELIAAGVAQRARGRSRAIDRFRERVMFPLADPRGRVLGFGARALGESVGPKYLNSSDGEVYHKGMHLYGAHLARSAAAKSGVVVLCEGYTDVIAMHQAGVENTVGLMGTALTEQQVALLSRIAQVVLLALDADTAGQAAMLKAAQLASKRKLELRVVELPSGTDPAELIASEGAEAMKAAISAAVPFVRFRVAEVLAAGDASSPEGRDSIIAELRPIFATIPPSAVRLDLARLASSTLSLSESLLEGLLARGERRSPPQAGESAGRGRAAAAPSRATNGRRGAEHAFLALCIACPAAGAEALNRLRVEDHLTEEALRKAAVHLRDGRLANPMSDLDEGDPQLARTLAELVVEAGVGEASEAGLRVCELQLEVAYLDRSIQAARSEGQAIVTELATRRERVKRDLDAAQELALAEP